MISEAFFQTQTSKLPTKKASNANALRPFLSQALRSARSFSIYDLHGSVTLCVASLVAAMQACMDASKRKCVQASVRVCMRAGRHAWHLVRSYVVECLFVTLNKLTGWVFVSISLSYIRLTWVKLMCMAVTVVVANEAL